MNQTTLVIVIVAVVLVAVAIAAWVFVRKRRTQKLRSRFGSEYEHTVREIGNKGKAEAELDERKKRVAKLQLHPLTAEEQNRFAKQWAATQARFVDDPKAAVADANRLVKEVMQARGYPVGDFEQRAADISVDHPTVVSNYRAAREIAARSEQAKASTEDLRKAVVYYRGLFEELLGTPELVGAAK